MDASHRRKRKNRRALPLLFLLCAGTALAVFLFSICFPLFSGQAEGDGFQSPSAQATGTFFSPRAVSAPAEEGAPGTGISGELRLEDVESALAALRREFPDGSYWNHMDGEEEGAVTDTPCQHSVYGEDFCNHYSGGTQALFPQYSPMCQCLGFAALLSDRIFGEDAPLRVHRDFNSLLPGDHIRLTEAQHSMIVVEKEEDGVTVAEVNSDYETCQISWGRFVSREELSSYGENIEYITRYP